jgi:hypothetical protein
MCVGNKLFVLFCTTTFVKNMFSPIIHNDIHAGMLVGLRVK